MGYHLGRNSFVYHIFIAYLKIFNNLFPMNLSLVYFDRSKKSLATLMKKMYFEQFCNKRKLDSGNSTIGRYFPFFISQLADEHGSPKLSNLYAEIFPVVS